jgi:hypothetical protein
MKQHHVPLESTGPYDSVMDWNHRYFNRNMTSIAAGEREPVPPDF